MIQWILFFVGIIVVSLLLIAGLAFLYWLRLPYCTVTARNKDGSFYFHGPCDEQTFLQLVVLAKKGCIKLSIEPGRETLEELTNRYDRIEVKLPNPNSIYFEFKGKVYRYRFNTPRYREGGKIVKEVKYSAAVFLEKAGVLDLLPNDKNTELVRALETLEVDWNNLQKKDLGKIYRKGSKYLHPDTNKELSEEPFKRFLAYVKS